jgi:hypothetical protein
VKFETSKIKSKKTTQGVKIKTQGDFQMRVSVKPAGAGVKASARRTMRLFGFLVTALVINTGCGKQVTLTDLQLLQHDTSPETPVVSFSTKIKPALDSKCTSCHAGILANYSALMGSGWVVPAKSANSKFYTKIVPGQSMAPFTQGTSLLPDIQSWIDAGAQDN